MALYKYITNKNSRFIESTIRVKYEKQRIQKQMEKTTYIYLHKNISISGYQYNLEMTVELVIENSLSF